MVESNKCWTSGLPLSGKKSRGAAANEKMTRLHHYLLPLVAIDFPFTWEVLWTWIDSWVLLQIRSWSSPSPILNG